MSSAEQLAVDLEVANSEVIAFAESCSPAEWETVVPGEEWTVALVIHHIAASHQLVNGWIGQLRHGEAVSNTRDDIDDQNAHHASDFVGVSVEATVELLRANGAVTAATIRSLTDEELERSGAFAPADGRPITAGQMAGVATTHPRGHLEHAAGALGRG